MFAAAVVVVVYISCASLPLLDDYNLSYPSFLCTSLSHTHPFTHPHTSSYILTHPHILTPSHHPGFLYALVDGSVKPVPLHARMTMTTTPNAATTTSTSTSSDTGGKHRGLGRVKVAAALHRKRPHKQGVSSVHARGRSVGGYSLLSRWVGGWVVGVFCMYYGFVLYVLWVYFVCVVGVFVCMVLFLHVVYSCVWFVLVTCACVVHAHSHSQPPLVTQPV